MEQDSGAHYGTYYNPVSSMFTFSYTTMNPVEGHTFLANMYYTDPEIGWLREVKVIADGNYEWGDQNWPTFHGADGELPSGPVAAIQLYRDLTEERSNLRKWLDRHSKIGWWERLKRHAR